MAQELELETMLVPAGAVHHENGLVSFALFAPFKNNVSVIGDFNGWNPDSTPMALQADGLWTAQVMLISGEHAYQFVIDGNFEKRVTIADPYSRKLRWIQGNGVPHSVVAVGKPAYEWGDGGFNMKPLNQLIIYELHVGSFSPSGTFKGVTEQLDYIRDLGVNAIELMPIQESPGYRSWGYNPAYFFCPKSAYGEPEDLKELIDRAHRHGIAVLLDMEFNHTYSSNPLTMLYAYQDSPYFDNDANPWGFPDVNHWSDATKRFMGDVQAFWLNEFHVDGFRYDRTHWR